MRGKVLITGANGILGKALIRKFNHYEILACDKNQLDITNRKLVSNFFEKNNINIVIHAAALTNVDECEQKPDLSYQVNTTGTQNLVSACIGKNIKFVYISSTGIYGEHKEDFYNEFDFIFPTTIHHKSKYEAEKIVQTHLNNFLILRTGWLFGGESADAKNFVCKRYQEAFSKEFIYANDLQKGNPTSAKDFCAQIELLIEENISGIYNCVNKGIASRFEYVEKIVECFNLPCIVLKANKTVFNRVAPVSKNESAQNYKLELMGLNIMEHWQDSLEKYIEDLKKEMM